MGRMDLFKNDINFVTDDLKGFIEKNDLPETKVKNFTSTIKYALLLGFKEKEIFFFGLSQPESLRSCDYLHL